jgi:hypothetical protein
MGEIQASDSRDVEPSSGSDAASDNDQNAQPKPDLQAELGTEQGGDNEPDFGRSSSTDPQALLQ